MCFKKRYLVYSFWRYPQTVLMIYLALHFKDYELNMLLLWITIQVFCALCILLRVFQYKLWKQGKKNRPRAFLRFFCVPQQGHHHMLLLAQNKITPQILTARLQIIIVVKFKKFLFVNYMITQIYICDKKIQTQYINVNFLFSNY